MEFECLDRIGNPHVVLFVSGAPSGFRHWLPPGSPPAIRFFKLTVVINC